MITTALLMGVLLLPQEPNRLIRNLTSDDSAARDRAERQLIETGAAALPKLKPYLNAADRDLRTRVTRIVSEIRRRAALAEVYGPVVNVTLDVKETPFREVLRRLERQSGFELWVEKDVEDRPISVRLDRAPYLKAVTEIARAHGGVRIQTSRAQSFRKWREASESKRADFILAAGKSKRQPVLYRGPVRVSIEGINRKRSDAWGESAELECLCLWQPNVRPIGLQRPDLEAVVTDGGTDCLRSNGKRDLPEPTFTLSHDWSPDLNKSPGMESRSLSVVRGRLFMWFALERPSVSVRRPQDNLGKVIRVGDFIYAVKSVEPQKDEVKITVIGKVPEASPLRGVSYLAESSLSIRWLDAQGNRLNVRKRGSGRSKSGVSMTYRVDAKEWEQLDTLELTTYSNFVKVEIPYEFRDVALPRW